MNEEIIMWKLHTLASFCPMFHDVTISPIKKILKFFILLLGLIYMDVEVMLLLLLDKDTC
jgi:hypothetical protein